MATTIGALVRERARQARERSRRFWDKHRLPLLIICIGLAILILLFTITKAYLAVRLLVGNDLILELHGPPGSQSAGQGERRLLPYSVAVTANPFCEASCVALLRDVGNGTTIDAQEFSIRTGDPYTVEHAVTLPERGAGQAMYRYEVTCAATPELLCHTTGIPVSRSTITMIAYAPDARKRAQLATARDRLLAADRAFAQGRARLDAIAADLAALNRTIDTDEAYRLAAAAHSGVTDAIGAIADATTRWSLEDADGLERVADDAERRIAPIAAALDAAQAATDNRSQEYRVGRETLWRAHTLIADASARPIPDAWRRAQLDASIGAYRQAHATLIAKTGDAGRHEAIGLLEAEAIAPMDGVAFGDNASALVIGLFSDTALDALCAQAGMCIPHPTLADRLGEHDRTVRDACGGLEAMRTTIMDAHAAFAQEATASGTFGNDTLARIAQERAEAAWRAAAASKGMALNSTQPLERVALLALTAGPASAPAVMAPGNTTDVNLTPLVGIALLGRLPACAPANLTSPALPPLTLEELPSAPVPEPALTLQLPDPQPRCCVAGACAACCDNGECKTSLAAPIIFLHGHAFNRDTSAAYSLDAFEKLQRQLEDDGYVGLGTIDLSDTSVIDGSWTRGGTAVSVKASYYYDVYAGADNAGLVQTKTENIDTYAIRLNDIIEETRRRTGQDRVSIVAHSMGGLVARRYLQIFGDAKVDRLIMIGTPNAGISGSVAGYCTLLGEDLECRDLKEGSLFLNKLERAPKPDIPVSVIIGSGCDMGGEDGDGVVTVGSATLPWADARMVNGTCDGIDTLHTLMLDTDAYPITHEYVLQELRR